MSKKLLIILLWCANILLWGGLFYFFQYKYNRLHNPTSQIKIELINNKPLDTSKNLDNLNKEIIATEPNKSLTTPQNTILNTITPPTTHNNLDNTKNSIKDLPEENNKEDTKTLNPTELNINNNTHNTSNITDTQSTTLPTKDNHLDNLKDSKDNPREENTAENKGENTAENKPENKLELYRHLSVKSYNRNKIAIVLVPLGFNLTNFIEQVKALPSVVSLALYPYGNNLNKAVQALKLQNKELWLALPFSSPNEDNGPLSLHLDEVDNLKNLQIALNSFKEYAGCMVLNESPLLNNINIMEPLLKEIVKINAAFVDIYNSKSTEICDNLNLFHGSIDMLITFNYSQIDLDNSFIDLEKTAQIKGSAIMVMWALPNNIQALQKYLDSMNTENTILVPLSQLCVKN